MQKVLELFLENEKALKIFEI